MGRQQFLKLTPVPGHVLWKIFEAALDAEGAKFSDFDPRTNWGGVLTELGFTALESGKLLKMIVARNTSNGVKSFPAKKLIKEIPVRNEEKSTIRDSLQKR